MLQLSNKKYYFKILLLILQFTSELLLYTYIKLELITNVSLEIIKSTTLDFVLIEILLF